jgi:hypothetical protein
VSALSTPSVWQPLFECTPIVVVSGYMPGATIDIYAQPPGGGGAVHIGGGSSSSASGQVFGVDATRMVASAVAVATQTYAGVVSPPSPAVSVQSPLAVTAPLLHAPLYECANCVLVDGMLPGSIAEVSSGRVLGSSPAYAGSAEVGVSPALGANVAVSAVPPKLSWGRPTLGGDGRQRHGGCCQVNRHDHNL